MNLKIEHPPATLRELCQAKLRDAIITGYFPSGTRLVERSLGEELGVSRSVIREVIRYLEAEGLVEILANKGPIVATLNWDAASQIYQVRLLLEQSAVADCTRNLTEATAQELKTALVALKDSFTSGDITLILSASSKLYETIFTTARHQIAWEIVQRLNGRISRLRAMTLNYADREVSGQQRIQRICEAIYLHKDTEMAKQAVLEHITEAAAIAQRILAEQEEEK